ncbi:MAG: sodium-independent anion transporter, partial [Mesorhizobium sp.]|nr:sodium-independent anion transporter [Mesorhizobium sp.]
MRWAAAYFPIFDWGRRYDRSVLTSDLLAALIVTIMLIPQSLAYAMLAGLPPQVGLYASILPLVAYAIFGTSRTLSVGPVAVVSLMTASAIGEVAAQGTAGYLEAAIVLALISGIMLLAMGLLRLGFVANFLSHPVISGFITASGILIAASQLKHVLGVKIGGETFYEIIVELGLHARETNLYALAIGSGVLAFLYFVRLRLKSLLISRGLGLRPADMITKAGPVLAVGATIAIAAMFDLGGKGVALVGVIPVGLPVPGLPAIDLELVRTLAVPALLISLIGFVESVSVAQTLAAKRRQRIVPDQELIGLG